jgi:bifunctional non-homologous end joining protein LigD
VGTGFSDKELAHLKSVLTPLETDDCPFAARLTGPQAKGVTYVRPVLVGEVRFGERTSDGMLRHPSWRGLRPEKDPADVVSELPI